jgi:hypothetical protein
LSQYLILLRSGCAWILAIKAQVRNFLGELRRTHLLRGWVNKAEYPAFVQSLYELLCKHHSQGHRVAHTTNTTHKYSANPVRICSSKTIASFCWNGTASGMGSPHRQLSKQTRSQVHRQQARDHQQRHPYPLQHHRQHSERGSRLLKQLPCGLPYRLLQSCVCASRRCWGGGCLCGLKARKLPHGVR